MAEIKNLKKAADRIIQAIKEKERIVIFGDNDMDGSCSVIILKECINNLGGQISKIYFPDRVTEGYGLNKIALEKLKEEAPALLITLDCGIGNIDEVKIAKKMGFKVIIIDHHEIIDKIPKADIVVDPNQEGDKYPFKKLANVGLVYKLAFLLMGDKMTDSLRRDFSELAAMATIADMVDRTDDNEEIIMEGLASLDDSWRPGIQALLALESVRSLSSINKVNKMNSLLNIRNIDDYNISVPFKLLTIPNIDEAGKYVEWLLEKRVEKRRKINEVVEEIERNISAKKDDVILEGSSSWDPILLGVAASIISEKYNKPTFLYAKNKEYSQGSIRAPEGYNVVLAMKSCKKYLDVYGGHPKAAGFKLDNKNIEKFRECLIDYYDNI